MDTRFTDNYVRYEVLTKTKFGEAVKGVSIDRQLVLADFILTEYLTYINTNNFPFARSSWTEYCNSITEERWAELAKLALLNK